VSLWVIAVGTILPSGTSAVTNQNCDFICFCWIFASRVWIQGELRTAAISNLCCHSLPLTWRRRNAHAGTALCCCITGSLRLLDGYFKQFLSGNRAVAPSVNSTLQLILWKYWFQELWLFIKWYTYSCLIVTNSHWFWYGVVMSSHEQSSVSTLMAVMALHYGVCGWWLVMSYWIYHLWGGGGPTGGLATIGCLINYQTSKCSIYVHHIKPLLRVVFYAEGL